MFGIEINMGTKLAIIAIILTLAMYFFSTFMRKYLKVDKRKLFFAVPVNSRHKKIDWGIRIIFINIILISYFLESLHVGGTTWYFEIWFVMIMYLVVTELARAYMEWKYKDNSKAYVFTLAQLVFILLILSLAVIVSNNIFR